MIGAAKAALGSRLFMLGHHYQRDDVMRWADARGDSFGLSRLAAGQVTEAEFIVFCGVHFMAESADVLTGAHQQVLLPDLNAGCSMADMADIDQVEEAWEELARVIDVEPRHPRHLHELLGRPEGLRRAATRAPSAPRRTPGPC
jgi:quinolinate synthase